MARLQFHLFPKNVRRLFVVVVLLIGVSLRCAKADAQQLLKEGWRVQSSAKVTADGAKVSTPGFEPSGWYKASVPNTVFGVQVEDGQFKAPYFGMNLRQIPGVEYPIGGQFANIEMPANSPYAVPWWYRSEFELPKHYAGRRVWLAFHGINYRAELWINGKKVAGADQIVGAYRRFEFDVTDFVHAGAKNAVALLVSTPNVGDLAITFVDWNPMSPDKEMGLWQEVVLSDSGPVAIRHPFVETKFDVASDTAHLTVRANVKNATGSPVKGALKGTITGGSAPIEFSQPVELAANETREVTFAPETVSALNVAHPKLWWPYQMGEPYLHHLRLEFVIDQNALSDVQTRAFGMVQMDSELTPDGYRLFKVNGKPVLIRGGGWAPDMMLRVNEARREAEFRYVKEMGLNTIRLEGKLEDDSFFERADRDGILIMAGWCCCDAWEHWSKWGDENKRVSVESLRDQLLRLREHPSVFVWLNGSDNPPPPDREQAYLDVEKQLHWPNPVISSATAKKTEVTGESGVKMTGPYEYVPPDYWLLDTKNGGAFGFNTETSPGPAVPPLEELKSMFPADKLWPINEVWDFHAGGGEFKNINVFTNALEKRYGKAKDAADFAWKSQAMTYEGQRAMFEAYGLNKYKSTGVIQWMLNNAWPGLIWHLYDYSLRPAGGYFGTKSALELEHPQFSYADRTIAVVNGTQKELKGRKVVAKLFDLKGKELFSRDAVTDVPADGVAHLFAIPEPTVADSAYFLQLQLFNDAGELVGRNFYWLSTKPDTLDFSKSTWWYTPQSAYADFTALQDLPKATLRVSFSKHESASNLGGRAVIENTGSTVAFLVRLRLLHGPNGSEILPVYWQDNYISLMPGEKREISVSLHRFEPKEGHPTLLVDGYNVAPVTIH